MTVLAVEAWGAPLIRKGSPVVGLAVGGVLATATGFLGSATAGAAPSGTFLWAHTFPLGISGALVLPLLACCMATLASCLGDVAATAEASGLGDGGGGGVDGRVQGGLTAGAVCSVLAPLATAMPTACVVPSVGAIALTGCASRRAGYACCAFLVLAGVGGRLGAAVAALPASVVGGMTAFPFTSIAVGGLNILARERWTGRNRFIATVALVFGLADLAVPGWAGHLLPPGGGASVQGLKDGVSLVLGTSYCIVAFVALLLHAVMPEPAEEALLPAAGKREQ